VGVMTYISWSVVAKL